MLNPLNIIFKRRNKHLKKDYQEKNFVNPYFKREKKSGFNTVLYLKILFAGLIIYIVIYSALFKINQVNVYGTDMINQTELTTLVQDYLQAKSLYVLPHNNIIFFSKKRLAQLINDKYTLSLLDIDRQGKSLAVIVKEKISYLIVYNIPTQTFYFSDMNGSIIQEINKDEVADYWVKFPILNVNEEKIEVGTKLISKKTVEFILSLNEELKNISINIQGYEKRGADDIVLVAKDGWRAYFSVDSDPQISLENLLLVLKEKITQTKNLDYIDLTLGNKIFFKYKDAKTGSTNSIEKRATTTSTLKTN